MIAHLPELQFAELTAARSKANTHQSSSCSLRSNCCCCCNFPTLTRSRCTPSEHDGTPASAVSSSLSSSERKRPSLSIRFDPIFTSKSPVPTLTKPPPPQTACTTRPTDARQACEPCSRLQPDTHTHGGRYRRTRQEEAKRGKRTSRVDGRIGGGGGKWLAYGVRGERRRPSHAAAGGRARWGDTSSSAATTRPPSRWIWRPASAAASPASTAPAARQRLVSLDVFRGITVLQCSINSPQNGPLPPDAPSWCQAPFGPEGLLSSVMAIVTCLIGLQYGHVIVHFQKHKERIMNWLIPSFSMLVLAFAMDFFGMHMNKPLYTLSYTLATAGAAGLLFAGIYTLVDLYGYWRPTVAMEWMGMHALMIYVLIACNILPIFIHGFYWKEPKNNLLKFIGVGA